MKNERTPKGSPASSASCECPENSFPQSTDGGASVCPILFRPLRAARAGYVRRLLLFLFIPALLFANGCAKHPASTAPVGPVNSKATGKSDAVVKTARSKIGVRYKNGGTSPDTGFDCSGFVCWAYGQNGYSLPRTSGEQAKIGDSIKRTDLKPGDLLVFKISARRGYHTAIYTGGGHFIHSPRTGETIREDNLSMPYWDKRLISTRRIVRE